MTTRENTHFITMKRQSNKTKIKYTTDYEFWLEHKDEYIYIETNKNKSNNKND